MLTKVRVIEKVKGASASVYTVSPYQTHVVGNFYKFKVNRVQHSPTIIEKVSRYEEFFKNAN